jgi:hypothetical protein
MLPIEMCEQGIIRNVDASDPGFEVDRLVAPGDAALQGFDQVRIGTGHQ